MRTIIWALHFMAAAAMPFFAQGARTVPIQPGPPDFSWDFEDGSGNVAAAHTGGIDANILGTEGVAFDWSTDTLMGHGFALEHNPGHASPVLFGPNVFPIGFPSWSSFSFAGWMKPPASGTGVDVLLFNWNVAGGGEASPGDVSIDVTGNVGSDYVLGDFAVWNGGSSDLRANFSDVVMTGGEWHHFALVSLNRGQTLSVYVDGVKTSKDGNYSCCSLLAGNFWGFGNTSTTLATDQFEGIWAKLVIYSGPLNADNV